MKEVIKEKLVSRKFWVAAFSIITALVFTLTGVEIPGGEGAAGGVAAAISAVYIFSQAIVDAFASRADAQYDNVQLRTLLTQTQQFIAMQQGDNEEDLT